MDAQAIGFGEFNDVVVGFGIFLLEALVDHQAFLAIDDARLYALGVVKAVVGAKTP